MYKLCMQKWIRSYFNNLTPKQRRNVRQRMRETENKRDKNQCNRESEQCIVFCSVLSLYFFVSSKGFVYVFVITCLCMRVRKCQLLNCFVSIQIQKHFKQMSNNNKILSIVFNLFPWRVFDRQKEREREIKYVVPALKLQLHTFITISSLFVAEREETDLCILHILTMGINRIDL